MNKPAAIYARVSSDRQKENRTIASQTAALIEFARTQGLSVSGVLASQLCPLDFVFGPCFRPRVFWLGARPPRPRA
jgi:hypothetical protein